MNIKELKKELEKYDENLEVAATLDHILILKDEQDEESNFYNTVGEIKLG